MTKTKSSQKRMYLFAALLVAVALIAGIIPLTQTRAAALERPGEFGPTVGAPISCTYSGQAAQVQNYKGGYVVWKDGFVGTEGENRVNVLKVVTLKKVSDPGGTDGNFTSLTVTNFTPAEVATVHGTKGDNSGDPVKVFYRWDGGNGQMNVGGWEGFGLWQGSYDREVSYNNSSTGMGNDDGFKDHIQAAYINYYTNGLRDGNTYASGDFNIGISIDNTVVWEGIAPTVHYWYGDKSAFNDGGRIGNMKLMYNPYLKNAKGNGVRDGFLIVHSEPNRLISDGATRNSLGMPYTNLELVSALRGTDLATLPADLEDTDLIQVFEKAIVKVTAGVGAISHYGAATVASNKVVFTVGDPQIAPSVWGDLGSLQASKYVESGDKVHGFYNYQNGAAYALFDKSAPFTIRTTHQFGSATFDNITTSFNPGALTATALTRAQVRAKLTLTNVNTRAIDYHDGEGSGVTTQVKNILNGTGHTTQAAAYNGSSNFLFTAYTNKFNALRTDNVNIGLNYTKVKVWDGIIMVELSLGDSGANRDSRPGYGWVTYDATEQKARYIHGEFVNHIAGGGADRRTQSGYFLSDSHYQVVDNGTNRTVLLAVNGYYELVGSTVTWHNGKIWVPESEGSNIGAFVSTLTWRGDFGTKVGEPFDLDGYSYQNLTKGYLKYKVVGSEYIVTERANFNVSNDSGALAFTPLANDILWEGGEAFELSTSGGDNVANTLPGLTEPQKATIIANFKQAIVDSVASGWAPGFRISKVKNWDGFIVVEYKFGDGDMYHDGSPTSSRSRMTIFVMDTTTFEVYTVGNYALLYGSSAKSSLGYAVSNFHSSITVKIGTENVTLTNAQFFKQGYIHQVNGSARVVTGYVYTPAAGSEPAKLDPAAAPKVPEGYGAETGRVKHNNNVYINYAKGTVKALVNKSGTGYVYTYYYGRTYTAGEGDAAPAISKLPIESLVAESDFKTGTDYGGLPEKYASDKTAFLKRFYDAYKYWYDHDIILGKIDDGVKGWNGNNHILQFMFGDSSANPFGDSRTNIAALSYNYITDEIYLIANGAMNAFSKDSTINMPNENPQFNEKLGVWTQRYSSGKYIVWLGATGSVIDGETTSYDDYIAGRTKISATHGKDSANGYVETGEILLTELSLPEEVADSVAKAEAAGAVTSSVSIVGAAFIGLNKKKSKSKLLGRLK